LTLGALLVPTTPTLRLLIQAPQHQPLTLGALLVPTTPTLRLLIQAPQHQPLTLGALLVPTTPTLQPLPLLQALILAPHQRIQVPQDFQVEQLQELSSALFCFSFC
uniref:Secreted protein n=1 Tax=Taenia asiatica TaxID=60517 RepID=A0A0R3WE24_TAEAS